MEALQLRNNQLKEAVEALEDELTRRMDDQVGRGRVAVVLLDTFQVIYIVINVVLQHTIDQSDAQLFKETHEKSQSLQKQLLEAREVCV